MKNSQPTKKESASERLRLVLLRKSPTNYQKIKFLKRRGYWPNLRQPTTICEILTSAKLRVEAGELSQYTDKLSVREHIRKTAREKEVPVALTEIVHVSDSISTLDLSKVDTEVFIKTNHASGVTMHVTPENISREEINSHFDFWMKSDYSLLTGESSYAGIPRRIFIEKALQDESGNIPDDIKVHCYHGQPTIIQIIRRRTGEVERVTYNNRWEKIPVYKVEKLHDNTEQLPKANILKVASALSYGFDYVRVDLYSARGRLYFGELTFFPESGMLSLRSKRTDRILGEKYREVSRQPDEATAYLPSTALIKNVSPK